MGKGENAGNQLFSPFHSGFGKAFLYRVVEIQKHLVSAFVSKALILQMAASTYSGLDQDIASLNTSWTNIFNPLQHNHAF